MEMDNDVSGNGNSYTTQFRQYDPRLGRWKTPDPLAASAPGWNPYRFGFDNPIVYTDKNGLYETKREARQARRGARDEGIKGGLIKGRKGQYYFLDKNNGTQAYKNKKFDIKPGEYKGGVEFYDAADARGVIPPSNMRVGEQFKVGVYTLTPAYINGYVDYYVAGIKVKDPQTFEDTWRYDFIIGRDQLDYFEENIDIYETGAVFAFEFGAKLHLDDYQIDFANGDYGYALLKRLRQEWTNPEAILDALTHLPKTPSSRVIRRKLQKRYNHLMNSNPRKKRSNSPKSTKRSKKLKNKRAARTKAHRKT